MTHPHAAPCTPSPDPARYVSPVCRDGSHQACANFRGTCRCTCHAAAVEGTERPGGWVDGIGWVARLGDVADDDLIRHGEPISDPARDARRWYTPTVLVEVTRWADGSTPQPPAPERPDTAALLTIGDWLLRTLPGHQGAEQTAAALAYTARWIDAQPPVPPTPAPQADALEACDRLTDWLRATYDGSCRICGMGNEIVDQHADDCEAAPVLALATPPSTPVERPQPDEVSPDA